MRSELETLFVKSYIDKTRQSRLLLEFFDKKRRGRALDRFAHGVDSILKPHVGIVFDASKLPQVVHNVTKGADIYVVSSKYLDGTNMNSDNVLEYLQEENGPVLLLSSETNSAIIKPESYGSRNYYYLSNTKELL